MSDAQRTAALGMMRAGLSARGLTLIELVVAIAIYLGAVFQVYVLAWVVEIIGRIF
mgnify:CR=1 FL=1